MRLSICRNGFLYFLCVSVCAGVACDRTYQDPIRLGETDTVTLSGDGDLKIITSLQSVSVPLSLLGPSLPDTIDDREVGREQGEQFLTVGIETTHETEFYPMTGSYHLTGTHFVFKPILPFVPEQSYIVRMMDCGKLLREEPFLFRRAEADAPEIESIFPLVDELPANHLKFYIYFNQPMQTGDIFDYFSLWDMTRDKLVARPFRHTELWSKDGLRLTLWFHPGRQKTGVNLNVELGPVLTQGHRYQLRVDASWRGMSGESLGKTVIKEFVAGPADHTQPDPSDWKITVPRKDDSKLRVTLAEPLDHAMIETSFVIEHLASEEQISTSITVELNERVLVFTPHQPWRSGHYSIVINPLLEDLSGNSLERPFEVDLQGVALPVIGNRVEFTVE